MAHTRKRHIHDRFEKLCKFSPIVGLFGHRQVGKTTFVESGARNYISFDDDSLTTSATLDPAKFLKDHHSSRTVIDECQLVPKIFPALKEWVRKNKKPGQFILSGSVRFTSRKIIRESLTGRIVSSELLPLTVTELIDAKLSHHLTDILKTDNLHHLNVLNFDPNFFKKQAKAFEQYLTHGGLPGICFVRDSKTRKDYLDTLLNLILDRDLRQVTATRLSLKTLKQYLQWIAKNALKPYSYAEVKRALNLSELTQKRLLLAFESIYLIRILTIDGAKAELILLEDQLEELEFSEKSLNILDQKITAFYRNIRAQFVYQSGMRADFFQYRTRGGAFVPLALKSELGTMGFIFLENDQASLSEKRSAESFLRKYPRSKILYIAAHESKAEVIAADIFKVSLSSII